MGLSPESVKVKNWEVNNSDNNNNNSKSRKVKKKKDGGAEQEEEEEIGCWVRFRFIESCMPSRSKVDSSMSGTSTNYGNCFCFLFLSHYFCYEFYFHRTVKVYNLMCEFNFFLYLSSSGFHLSKVKIHNFFFPLK